MSYSIEILRSAQKQLTQVDKNQQEGIIDAVRKLAGNPRPAGCKKLSGRDAWRIRIGSYRVIYEIHDRQLRILVITIGNRKDIYR